MKGGFWRLLFVFALCATVAACHYPYNTKQAREARKTAKLEKAMREAQEKIAQATVKKDSIVGDKKSRMGLKDSVAVSIKDRKGKILPTDSLAVEVSDSLKNIAGLDSLKQDSAKLALDSIPKNLKKIRFSKDSLDAPVEYLAMDSMLYEIDSQRIWLWGNANVKYKEMEIKAPLIIIDFKTKIARAEAIPDSLTGRVFNDVSFKDGDQNFDAKKIIYNFETKKGKVYDAVTQEGDAYLQSKASKFISKDANGTGNDVIYSQHCLYTSCDRPEAHFGIRATKAKIVPNKLIVIGPSYLELGGVPTPLGLPFGFFPITSDRKSGLIIPKDFDQSPKLGFGLKNIGYYFGINDKVDLQITGDIYTRGSWGLHADSRYKTRYKYNGSIGINFSNQKFGLPEDSDYELRRDFRINWSHNQDAGAHPSRKFSASMRLGTGNYQRNNYNDLNSVLENNLTSTVSLSKNFGSKASITLGLSHNQDVSTHKFNLTLPEIAFNLNQFNPFKRKKALGKERWYEQITFSYNNNFRSTISTADTLFFSDSILNILKTQAQFGMRHSPKLAMSFKLFKFISVNPSIDYSEIWYPYSTRQVFDETITPEFDTILNADGSVNKINDNTKYGSVTSERVWGFNALREFGAAVNLTTNLYGMSNIKIGKLRAFRHTLRPSIGMSWKPDYDSPFWGYRDSVRVDTRYPTRYSTYNRYQGYALGTVDGVAQASINWTISNVFEAKVKNKKDTTGTDKKIKVLNLLSMSGSYNFLADSLKMSTINLSANTPILKIIQFNTRFTFDPYDANRQNNTRVNTFLWKSEKKLARLTSFTANLSTTLNPNTIQEMFGGKDKPKTANKDAFGDKNRDGEIWSPKDFFQSVSINYNLQVNRKWQEGKDTTVVIQSIDTRSKFQLTRNWSVQTSLNYDFTLKRIAYPTLALARRLHCWEMSFSWEIERKTWTFSLYATNPTLSFLKVPARKSFYDPF